MTAVDPVCAFEFYSINSEQGKDSNAKGFRRRVMTSGRQVSQGTAQSVICLIAVRRRCSITSTAR
jgi:hypothetical protein